MRRNIFWTAWGLVGLACMLFAGIKSFATEIRKQVEAREHKYIAECGETDTTDRAGR